MCKKGTLSHDDGDDFCFLINSFDGPLPWLVLLDEKAAAKGDGKEGDDDEGEEEDAEEDAEDDGEEEKSGKKRKAPSGGGGGGGFTAPLMLSDALADLLGHKALGRTTVVKLLWRYFRVRKACLQKKEEERETVQTKTGCFERIFVLLRIKKERISKNSREKRAPSTQKSRQSIKQVAKQTTDPQKANQTQTLT